MTPAAIPSKTFWRIGFSVHLLLVVAIGVSAYLGWLPGVNRFVPRIDFFCHAVLIGLLAFFLDGVLGFRPLLPNRSDGGRWSCIRLAPVLVLTLAAAEELAQSLVPNRSCSLSDFVGDLIGVGFFSWLAWRVERWRQHKRQLA